MLRPEGARTKVSDKTRNTAEVSDILNIILQSSGRSLLQGGTAGEVPAQAASEMRTLKCFSSGNLGICKVA